MVMSSKYNPVVKMATVVCSTTVAEYTTSTSEVHQHLCRLEEEKKRNGIDFVVYVDYPRVNLGVLT